MWLITPVGFFSIVEKPEDKKRDVLTIRARVRSDLTALKTTFLPALGRISESTDTDYRYRAKAPRAAVSKATAEMIASLHYSNFKSEVAERQGAARAHLYHDVWDALYQLQGNPAFDVVHRSGRAR